MARSTISLTQIETISKQIGILIEPEQVVELRVMGVDGRNNRTDSGYFDNVDSLAAAAATYSGRASSVYMTLNPVQPALLARAYNRMEEYSKTTTSDKDIAQRRWFMIDFDPVRPSDISSTDEEHENAIAGARLCRDWLTSRGWPCPVLADSGNGAHLLYRIDMPTMAVNELLSKALQAIAMTFDDGRISVDIGNFNPARIWKVYGTLAAKGDSMPTRPHREARILEAPEIFELVAPSQLNDLVMLLPEPEVVDRRPGEKFDLASFITKYGLDVNEPRSWNGGTRWVFRTCPWNSDHTDKSAYIVQFSNGAIAAGCHHNSCQGQDWKSLREKYEGIKEPYQERRTERPKQIVSSDASLDLVLLAIKALGETTNGLDDQHRKNLLQPLAQMVGQLSDEDRKFAINALYPTYLRDDDDLEWFLDLCPDTSQDLHAVKILRRLGYSLRLNMLEDMVEIDGKRLDDVTRSAIYLKMSAKKIAKTYVDDAINVLASEQTYHPIQDYLLGLKWDGVDHLTALLQHIKGDDKTVTLKNGETAQLHWRLLTRWLLGCVARGLDGNKGNAFKHQTPMLVFIGGQGIGKSSFVRWLASGVGYEYHRESPINPHGTEDVRSMVTKWLWEVSELGSSLRRGDRDALKSFITQEWHTYRKPWGKASITKPTLCNLVGTVNPETGFLDDPTGYRRFLPVVITGIDHSYESSVDINQLWAQIVHLYQNGASPELSKSERQALADSYVEHEVENPLQTYIQMYFNVEPGNEEMKCFTATIMSRLKEFGISVNNDPKIAGRQINDALAPLGLSRKKISIDGIKAMGWVGIEANGVSALVRVAFHY